MAASRTIAARSSPGAISPIPVTGITVRVMAAGRSSRRHRTSVHGAAGTAQPGRSPRSSTRRASPAPRSGPVSSVGATWTATPWSASAGRLGGIALVDDQVGHQPPVHVEEPAIPRGEPHRVEHRSSRALQGSTGEERAHRHHPSVGGEGVSELGYRQHRPDRQHRVRRGDHHDVGGSDRRRPPPAPAKRSPPRRTRPRRPGPGGGGATRSSPGTPAIPRRRCAPGCAPGRRSPGSPGPPPRSGRRSGR